MSSRSTRGARHVDKSAKRRHVGPKKFDGGKLRLELIPPELLEAAARGLGFGAEKYSAGNWATGEGFEWSRLYGGLQRHLWAFWHGIDIDEESGNHHLDHAACMLAFLLAHVRRRHGRDDRLLIGVTPRRKHARRLPDTSVHPGKAAARKGAEKLRARGSEPRGRVHRLRRDAVRHVAGKQRQVRPVRRKAKAA